MNHNKGKHEMLHFGFEKEAERKGAWKVDEKWTGVQKDVPSSFWHHFYFLFTLLAKRKDKVKQKVTKKYIRSTTLYTTIKDL